MIWENISYLSSGNEKQKKAYNILTKLKIFDILSTYNPLLVGTIPIDIDIDNSDLDIICEVYNFEEFEKLLKNSFKMYNNFSIKKNIIDIKQIIINFIFEGFEIEIFGEAKPTKEQNGYRHLLIETRLLKLAGEKSFVAIRQLKKEGLKTEPAFAKYFNLMGNPYQILLQLETFSDDELYNLIIDIVS